jgi:hypothetical protein
MEPDEVRQQQPHRKDHPVCPLVYLNPDMAISTHVSVWLDKLAAGSIFKPAWILQGPVPPPGAS